VRKIKGFFQFLYSIVNTAKDWQDTLQARLTGYSERIVEIRLDEEKEGGLNLNMDRQTIERLEGYGREAGEKLVKEFNFDEHRWLRALSFMSRLEGSLETLSERYDSAPVGADETGMTYRQILTEYPAAKYTNTDEWRRNVLDPFVRKLSDMGKKAGEDCRSGEGQCVRDGNVPKTLASIRLIADAQDRGPSNDPDNPAV
jgi:hypothetical protein